MYTDESDNFDELYKNLVSHVLNEGVRINPRGKETLECVGCSITLTNIDNSSLNFRDSLVSDRQDKYENYRDREIKWYESGCLNAKCAPSSNIWEGIADQDGNIQSNYGYIILKKIMKYEKAGISSFGHAIDLLVKDESSRQVILHYNLPENYEMTSNDIPCTICTQVLIREGKLSFIVYQRSSDLYYGLPYDMYWHCYLLKKFIGALKLKNVDVDPGSVTIIFGSVHIYEDKRDWFDKYLEDKGESN